MDDKKRSLCTVFSEDGAAILDPRSGQITTLNSTGAFIWRRLEEGLEATTIAALLAAETVEALSTVEPQVNAFLAQLNEYFLRAR